MGPEEEMIRLGPVDPRTISVGELKFRAAVILMGMAKIPEDPLPPGWVRCYLCLRSNAASPESLARASADSEAAGIPPERVVILCPDCDQIISRAGN